MKRLMRSSCAPNAIPVACLLLLAAASAPLHATILSYGGDPSPSGGSGYDAFYDIDSTFGSGFADNIYGDFTVPLGQYWKVTAVYGQIGDPDPANQTPLANWDIRTGVTTSSLGTEVAHGTSTISTTTWVPFADAIDGDTSFTLTVNLSSTPVILTGGQTYFLSVQPIGTSDFNMFMGVNLGSNLIGSHDKIYYYTDSNFPGEIASTPNYVSEGVEGSETTPEPATLMLVGSMLAALILGRRRWRRALHRV